MFQVTILWLLISQIHFSNPRQIDMLPEAFLSVEQGNIQIASSNLSSIVSYD